MKHIKEKLLFFTIVFCLTMLSKGLFAQCPIIPKPLHSVKGNDQFELNSKSVLIVSTKQLDGVANYLRTQILDQTEIPILKGNDLSESESTIFLELIKDDLIGEESYNLSITSGKVHISATSVSGVFYGAVSLLQLILKEKPSNRGLKIPSWEIKDSPNYEWRGLMLDVSRFFIPKEKILSILDWMAFYKLNTLHWHLTDTPGWRVEILKYPDLALVGGIGDHFDPEKPAQYYTQKEIALVVDYATKLNIKVIPEIDMPGHATAANRAYPEFSGGGSEKYPEFTFNPSKEETYDYLTSILKEINVMFPNNMIHLGGDEVSFGNEKWGTDKNITTFIRKHKIAGLKGLENYFMQRMADSVFKMNAKVLAWDELAESSLPRDKTIVLWWRHDKPEQLNKALENGFSTVITPRIPYYFDFVQNESHKSGRKWAGEFSPIEAVYNFDVNKFTDYRKYRKQILGVQGSLWTETVNSENRLDYLLFPRIAALSESSWVEVRTNYPAFEKRLKPHLDLYKKDNIYYYNPLDPNEIPEPVVIKKN